ncbi:MAG TPA: helicase-related protein [Dehalococcoidia bacterium]|nr:helicase-related protein [Dehalococcoidia bacterium]
METARSTADLRRGIALLQTLAIFAYHQRITKKEDSEEQALPLSLRSPCWPFVLVTTSIGQEGLDFHPYCHAIVHWDLPSNPVELEQREGRVHRYKVHAVRRNLATRYWPEALTARDGTGAGFATDPWDLLFRLGTRDRPPGASDLVPFWIYPLDEGAVIKRHAPLLLPLAEP